jgi:mannose/cellobiose epimerase-like protein (N-acyl-D-glucosamine 2-epimerase family)
VTTPFLAPAERTWLAEQTERLLAYGHVAALPEGGFGWLDGAGGVDRSYDRELWITCRMTHVYSLGAILGHPGSAALVNHGLAALESLFWDGVNGGWYPQVDAAGQGYGDKAAYPHSFTILAPASALAAAGRDPEISAARAQALLDQALAVAEAHFWDEAYGMVREEFDPTWAICHDYRGINANMHTVEAYLAASDALTDPAAKQLWLDRAVRIIGNALNRFARGNGWRIPEHYDATWTAHLDYNRDNPTDKFRPYGATIGHGMEWARLALHARAALGEAAPAWLLEAAVALFDRAKTDGWAVDGAPGFVYTVDWDGTPVVHEREHWVVAEAIGAAYALGLVTGEAVYRDCFAAWWDFARQYLIEPDGSWLHELDAQNRPSAIVWEGKPDIYHAIQATLIPRLPLAPTLTPALAAGLLDA